MPPRKRSNPDSCRAIVSEETEILSPKLQQAAKATPSSPSPAPVAASDRPSRPSAKADDVLIASVPIPAHIPAPVPVSISSAQSGSLSAQSGAAGIIPPHAPPADQSLVTTRRYRYLFPLVDETAPRQVLDRVRDLRVPVPVKGLLVDVPGFGRQLREHITVKRVTTNSAHVVAGNASILPISKPIASNAFVFFFTISPSNLRLASRYIGPMPLSSGYSSISFPQSVFNPGTVSVLAAVSSYATAWHALAYKPVATNVRAVMAQDAADEGEESSD